MNEKINTLIVTAKDHISALSTVDLAVIFSALLSFGALIGSFFSDVFKKLRVIFILINLAAFLYMIWRLFQDDIMDRIESLRS